MAEITITPEQANELFNRIDQLENQFNRALDIISYQGKLIREMHQAFYPAKPAQTSRKERIQEIQNQMLLKVAKKNSKNIQGTGSEPGE